MTNFEEKLEKLEQISRDIKKANISLDEALKDFEEGIKLARGMEKEIDKIEGKIQILMNQPNEETNENPQIELFESKLTDSSEEPERGTRK